MNSSRTKNIIIISPHADDEIIGCGGMISRSAESGDRVTVVVMATGGVKHCHLKVMSPTEKRVAEFQESARRLGVAKTVVLFPDKDMKLDIIPSVEIVSALDSVLNEHEYDECYIPEPSHNKDHRVTYESALASLRPGARKQPQMVATYESASSSWWNKSVSGGDFYCNITGFLEKKLFALEAYQSQLQCYPHPVSSDALERLAAYRGMECGSEYAERFHIIRMIKE